MVELGELGGEKWCHYNAAAARLYMKPRPRWSGDRDNGHVTSDVILWSWMEGTPLSAAHRRRASHKVRISIFGTILALARTFTIRNTRLSANQGNTKAGY